MIEDLILTVALDIFHITLALIFGTLVPKTLETRPWKHIAVKLIWPTGRQGQKMSYFWAISLELFLSYHDHFRHYRHFRLVRQAGTGKQRELLNTFSAIKTDSVTNHVTRTLEWQMDDGFVFRMSEKVSTRGMQWLPVITLFSKVTRVNKTVFLRTCKDYPYNHHKPNIHALNSDTHTLRIQYEYT